MVSEDIILFSVLGIVMVYSCALHIKRCRRERRRVAALVEPTSEVVYPVCDAEPIAEVVYPVCEADPI